MIIHLRRLPGVLLALLITTFVGRAQTPPAFSAAVAGQRQVAWNYTGLRPISAAPAIGVHPRVFIGPDQRAEVCNRLTNTVAGQELFTNYVQRYTAIMRLGRSAGYDSLPVYSQVRYMPDGTSRISNEGFYDQSFTYTNLVAAQTNNIYWMMTNSSGSVFARTLAGELALEALECWVLQGQTNIGTRATNLAVAMDTWATFLLAQKNFTNSAQNWMLGGGAAFAEAYDFNYWAMTPAQCAHVRTALARIIYAAPYYGVGLAPEAVTSNWASLNTFNLIMIMAMEGETSAAVEGFDTNYFNTYFSNAMGAVYDFITYGWHPTGEMFEGMGKGWFGGARQIAFAKRGYNFFGHPHLQNYVQQDWPACLQPFGYSWSHYDLIGGEGADNLRGLRYYTASDEIAMQYVYTNFPAAAFLWRNFAMTAWSTNSPANGTNNYRAFLDFRDGKFAVSSSYGQDLLEAACFVQNVTTNLDWNAQSATVRSNLDFIDTWGSTIVGRSGTDSNAVSFQFHTRQDLGGHTFAERGGFNLSGLGRNWVWFPYALNYGQDSGFSSMVLVDDLAMYVTLEDGYKMRIPAKLAGWSDAPGAVFATCDSTYAYTWAWAWNRYVIGGSVSLNSGYQVETNCLNNFRRSNNLIPESHGFIPLVAYPHWDSPGYLEGFQRTSYNAMQQVVRTAGLVRGLKPYVFVADDIQKDANPHVYKWLLQIPKDLTLETGAALPAGFNPATDCLLPENPASGSRRLLVRVMSPAAWAAYTETVSNATYNSEMFYRLVIITTNVAPAFKVLLCPLAATDPIPTNTWTATNSFTVAIGSQTDTFTFYPRAVTTTDNRPVGLNEFTITRNGTNVMDYRNQIEPFASTVALSGNAPAAPATLSAAGGNYTASLAWSPVAGATGYNLKRGATSGGPYTNILVQIGLTNVVDNTVYNGQTYYYVVTALNAGGESAASPEASVLPGTVTNHTPAALVWAGDGTQNQWDNQDSANPVWLNTGTNTAFWNGDTVAFTDVGSTVPAVNLIQPLSPAGVVAVNSSNNYTFSGTGYLTGTAGLQKDGSGTLTINTFNTYTGATILNAGRVSINNPSALGTTNLIDFGGNAILQWNGITNDFSARMKIESGVTATVDTLGGNLTLASPLLVGGNGSGALAKTNGGALTLAAANTYAGGTTINGGYVNISADNNLGATNGPVTLNSGGWRVPSTVTTARAVTLGAGGGTFQPSSSSRLYLNGPVTGPGGLTVCWDADSIVLGSASNSYAGNTTIGANAFTGGWTSGNLRLGADNAIPNGAGKGNVVFAQGSGATVSLLDLNSHNVQLNGLVSGTNPNALVDNQSGTGTYSLTVGNNNVSSGFGGVIKNTTGKVALTKTGAGTLTLTGTNTYAGPTLINAGGLALSGYGSWSNTPLIGLAGGAVLDISGLTNSWVLGNQQTLSNSPAGTGLVAGNWSSGAGNLVLNYTNGTPALRVTNGTFALTAGSICSVNLMGPTLAAGSYQLIAKATAGNPGLVTGNLPALRVSPGGVSAGAGTALQLNGGELYLVVAAVPTTTSLNLTQGSNPALLGSPLTFSARVLTNGVPAPTATGNYVFALDNTPVATNPVTAGQAAWSAGGLAVGTHTVTVVYSGDGVFGASTNSLVQTVNPVPVLSGLTLAGTNLILTGANGAPGANYWVLAATNLSLPFANWNIIATNQFGPGGQVNATNPLNPNTPATFFRLEFP